MKLPVAVRVLMLSLVAALVAGATACHDEPYGSDMAVCGSAAAPTSPTMCGPMTCPVGQICFVDHAGQCPDLSRPPPATDGGGSSGGGVGGGGGPCVDYRCVAPPADCDCRQACDSFAGASPHDCTFYGPVLDCRYG